jgi:inner membrane transporter RhtA
VKFPAPQGRGETQAVALVLAGAVSVQFGAALGVLLIERIGALGATTVRTVLAAVIVVAIVRPKLRGHSRTDLLVGLGFGLALGVMNLCFYEAAARLPLGAAVTLEFIGPLGLAVVMSRRLRDVAWVLLAGVGVYLLSEGGMARLDLVGVLFALGAAACWAAYIVLGSQASRRFPGASAVAVAMIVSTILMLPVGAATSGTKLLDPTVLAIGLVIAIASSALPYTMEVAALRRIPPRTFGVLMSIDPAVAALAGFLVLHQRLTVPQLIAIGLVIAASAGATITARSQIPPQA